ncbi:hypothetical protein PG988_003823 [Apiospora saccharicola]
MAVIETSKAFRRDIRETIEAVPSKQWTILTENIPLILKYVDDTIFVNVGFPGKKLWRLHLQSLSNREEKQVLKGKTNKKRIDDMIEEYSKVDMILEDGDDDDIAEKDREKDQKEDQKEGVKKGVKIDENEKFQRRP